MQGGSFDSYECLSDSYSSNEEDHSTYTTSIQPLNFVDLRNWKPIENQQGLIPILSP